MDKRNLDQIRIKLEKEKNSKKDGQEEERIEEEKTEPSPDTLEGESVDVDDGEEGTQDKAIEDPCMEVKEELAKAKEELEEMQGKFRRLYADFDNYKKRVNRDRIDLVKMAGKDIIKELLPVFDDFDRAFVSAAKMKDMDSQLEGFQLVFNKLKNILGQKGLQQMETIGEDFDPELHEAITEIPAPEKKLAGKIIDEVEKGYLLNNVIIRFPKVVVGK